jgi:hypothetical protein
MWPWLLGAGKALGAAVIAHPYIATGIFLVGLAGATYIGTSKHGTPPVSPYVQRDVQKLIDGDDAPNGNQAQPSAQPSPQSSPPASGGGRTPGSSGTGSVPAPAGNVMAPPGAPKDADEAKLAANPKSSSPKSEDSSSTSSPKGGDDVQLAAAPSANTPKSETPSGSEGGTQTDPCDAECERQLANAAGQALLGGITGTSGDSSTPPKPPSAVGETPTPSHSPSTQPANTSSPPTQLAAAPPPAETPPANQPKTSTSNPGGGCTS